MHRGLCQEQAKTVGALADELLALAPPERAIRAIVAFLAEPGLAELTERFPAQTKLGQKELADLRHAAEEHCQVPNHPRGFDGSWKDCFAANDALEKLESIAKGEALEPVNEQ